MSDERRYDAVQGRWYVDVYQVKRGDRWYDETLEQFLNHPMGERWRVSRRYEPADDMTVSVEITYG